MTGVRARRHARGRWSGELAAGDCGETWEARVARDGSARRSSASCPAACARAGSATPSAAPRSRRSPSRGEFRRAVHYTWEVNDRLRMVVDAARGPVRYEHDALGNLAAATYEDGRVDLRMPDAVGNFFRTQARSDRKYGPGGQLLESREPDGRVVTLRIRPRGQPREEDRAWTLPRHRPTPSPASGPTHWNGAGMLRQGRPPRRRGRDLHLRRPRAPPLQNLPRAAPRRWIWDGKIPLHEWVEGRPAALSPATAARSANVAVLDELAARRRRFERAAKPSQGPPDDSFAAPQSTTPAIPVWSAGATEPGTAEYPITWLFDPESFAPMAKLVGDARYAIVTDHLGTPTAMYDAAGAEVWSATIDAYGDLRNITGTRTACPFRWPGQYEDAETGLYYNRFRYYAPEIGYYLSQDPIGLANGLTLCAYPGNPLIATDPLGLATFYSVQSAADADRLRGGGEPWPAGLERANMGDRILLLGFREPGAQLQRAP